jgi:hypothetical protein
MSQASSVAATIAVIIIAVNAIQFAIAFVLSMLIWAIPVAVVGYIVVRLSNIHVMAEFDRRNAVAAGKPKPSLLKALWQARDTAVFS